MIENSPEQALLAASIAARAMYEEIKLSGEQASFSGSSGMVWQAVEEFYSRDTEAMSASVELLRATVEAGTPSPKKRKEYSSYLASLPVEGVSLPNVRSYIEESARHRLGNELAGALAMRRPKEEVAELVKQYQAIGEIARGEEQAPVSISSLLSERGARKGGLFISPKILNDALGGGLMPGHNITIFARPEVGKSAVAVNAAVGFAKKGVKVLYVGNEDPVEDLRIRALACITGKTLETMLGSPEQVEEEAKALGVDNLVFRDISPGTLAEVERLVRFYRPRVLIVDQLRNLLGGKSENFTNHLDRMAQGVRALGKRYGMVTISITQAGDSARDKPFLDDGDIDSSNTGIPGAADVLIGIGMTQDMQRANVRNLCICKNKLSGTHDNIQVKIDPLLSRIRG